MNIQLIAGKVGVVSQLREYNKNKVLEFSVATTENMKVKDQWVQETEWHNIKCWGKLAETNAAKLTKGCDVLIQGRKKTEKYKNREGVDVIKVVTIADKIERLAAVRQPVQVNDTQNLSPQDLEPQDGDMPF